MSAQIIDGRKIASSVNEDVKAEIDRLREQGERPPGLAVIQVGEDPASQVYVGHKRKDCEKVGVRALDHDLPDDTSQAALLELIDQLNADPSVDGILVQLPLPDHIQPESVIERIDPSKDVDGFHPYNIGRLAARMPVLRPCTPYGVMEMLRRSEIDPRGKEAVVVGASNIVGRPMALELLLAGATVTVCHRFTRDLEAHVRDAELLVVGVGRPGLVKGEWVRPGATVIDVGINRMDDGSLTGDVDFEAARERADWITPVPGGVGPMTRAMLMKNTLEARLARGA